MADWFKERLIYPGIHIDTDVRSQYPYHRSSSGGNVIRIRVQGRRSAERDLREPNISVETFNLGSGQRSSLLRQPTVTVETPGMQGGTEIPIKHLTTSPTNSGITQQIPVSVKVNSKGPLKAVPLNELNRSGLSASYSDLHQREVPKASPTLLPNKSNIFDSIEKEFDRFTAESKLFSNRKFFRQFSDDGDRDQESSSSLPRSPLSEKISINTTTFRSNLPSSADKKSDKPESARLGSSAVARAKFILDRVLRDLEEVDSGYSGSGETRAGFTLTPDELRDKIKRFNDSHGTSKMTQDQSDSDTFHGDIHINICLERSVTMLLQAKPPSLYTALNKKVKKTDLSNDAIEASVTLPKNTTTGLHVSSEDTARDAIQQLLNKFDILDDSKEFALFEQTIDNEQEIKLRKIASSEKPLLNYLKWSTECQQIKRFVLKEGDTAEIMWEAFSVPELSNFLRMLDFERKRQVENIRNKFEMQRKHMITRMNELET